jgi:nondiscriminating glutamyl-tRNA synthetase
MYLPYAEQLIKEGKAYRCFCTKERLEEVQNSTVGGGYDRHCRELPQEEIDRLLEAGTPYVIRQKMPIEGETKFVDAVFGEITVDNSELQDQILIKADGYPTYNFAVVIDDHLMAISHVIRGDDHIANTPKQLMVYEALGWEAPEFGHMTLIINSETGKKLSKRDNNILQFMSQYRELGYLPEAIVNYILLLGWTPETNQEIFSMEEAKKEFDPARLSTSPSMFDQQKMNWTNGQYINKLSDEDYLEFIKPQMAKVMDLSKYDDKTLLEIASLYKEEITFGAEIIEPLNSILNPGEVSSEEDLAFLNLDSSPIVFNALVSELQQIEEITPEAIKQAFKNIGLTTGIKGKNLFMPVRLKLTGVSHGIELVNIIKILGKEEVINRLKK